MKLLFVINNLKIGGTRSSLLNFLEYLGNYDFDIDLLVFSPNGEYVHNVPRNVSMFVGNIALQSLFFDLNDLKRKKKLMHLLVRGFISIIKKIFGEKRVMNYIYTDYLKNQIDEKSYDAIIGFQEGPCNDFVAQSNVKKRLFWIHNNYENLSTRGKGFEESYIKADKIIFVADASMETFQLAMPQYKNKMCVIKNILLQNKIREKSLDEIKDHKTIFSDALNIISVGRVAPQKAFERIIEIGKKLLENKLNFNWIILGDGPDRNKLEESVKENGLGEFIKFIGARKNPFPYIRKSDLFVLTSHYESQPMVIMEALTIGVPVISTNFQSAKELLKDSSYSMIVDNSVEGLYSAVEKVLYTPGLIKSMTENTKKFTYDNDKIVLQLLEVINN